MGFLVWVVIIIVFLAILGLGWNTFFEGVKKGADKIGISSVNRKCYQQRYRSCQKCVKGNNWQLAWQFHFPCARITIYQLLDLEADFLHYQKHKEMFPPNF